MYVIHKSTRTYYKYTKDPPKNMPSQNMDLKKNIDLKIIKTHPIFI
jgi:hypothetical protein